MSYLAVHYLIFVVVTEKRTGFGLLHKPSAIVVLIYRKGTFYAVGLIVIIAIKTVFTVIHLCHLSLLSA